MQGFSASAEDVPVLLMIDTAGCDMEEQSEEDGDSKRNEGEAKVRLTCIRPIQSHHMSRGQST